MDPKPRYGSGEGRHLTAAERALLVDNTDRLIQQFESELQAQLEAARASQEERARIERAAHERDGQARLAADRNKPPTSAELASVLAEAKRNLRAKYDGMDPDQPGWISLVKDEQLRLLGR